MGVFSTAALFDAVHCLRTNHNHGPGSCPRYLALRVDEVWCHLSCPRYVVCGCQMWWWGTARWLASPSPNT